VNPKLVVASYRRYLWERPGLIAVAGDFTRALLSRETYNARYGIQAPGGRRAEVLDRALAAVGLAALSLADRESWGWSMSFRGEELGVFCAVEPEGMICGRALDAPSDAGLIAVQRQKPGEPIVESRFETIGNDPARAVELYFELSVQTPTRIAVGDDGRGVLVQLVPGGDFARVANVDDGELLAMVASLEAEGELNLLDEILLFYECRCSDELVLEMVETLPEEQQLEVWADTDEIEIECPRCGREFVVRRKIGS
jgi:hypothetical protein